MNASSLEILAAPFTPFHTDGTLNLDPIEPYVDFLLSQEVNGVFICGTTGEGSSLTSAERCRLAEAWIKATKNRMQIIVHVGHNSLDEAAQLARHAMKSGADAISAMPPSFFLPSTPDVLVACSQKIAAAAPELPFFYYHIPSMSNVRFKVSDWIVKASEEIPNFSGVKFTFEDLEDFRRCRQLVEPQRVCYFGRDELFLDAVRDGAHAVVGSTYNFSARLYRKIARSLEEGNSAEAERLQAVARKFIDRLINLGFFNACKSLISFFGIELGPPRLPLISSGNIRAEELQAIAVESGMVDFLSKPLGAKKFEFANASSSAA